MSTSAVLISMSNGKLVRVYYEGNDDRAVLDGLHVHGVLPDYIEIAKRDKKDHPGKDGVLHQLAVFTNPAGGVGGNAIVLFDVDDPPAVRVIEWFQKAFGETIKAAQPLATLSLIDSNHDRIRRFEVSFEGRRASVVVIPVGLDETDHVMKANEISLFAIDDYLLRLILDQQVYEAIRELKEVPYSKTRTKLDEVRRLFVTNGLPIRRSKRLIHIIRAIIGFPASSATFIEQLLRGTSKEKVGEHFSVLLQDLSEALALLST